MNPILQRVSIDPAVCFGKPCIRGTRIWVSLVLDLLAEGSTEAEVLGLYPQLRADDIRACLLFAYRLVAHERVDPFPVGSAA